MELRRLADAVPERMEQFAFLEGHCAWSSSRSPDKDSANEDAALAIELDSQRGILAVADGVGGYRHGEFASRLLLDRLEQHLLNCAPSADTLRAPILDAIEEANAALLEDGRGAATTLAVLEFNGRSVRPYHVGDSSVFIVGQRGRLHFRSLSHAPVAFGIESGVLAPSAALQSEERHYVSNIVGTREMRIEVGAPWPLADFDTVLLCSDGLNDNLAEHIIIDTVRCGSLRVREQQLRAAARVAMLEPEGHPDDLTLVLYRARGGAN